MVLPSLQTLDMSHIESESSLWGTAELPLPAPDREAPAFAKRAMMFRARHPRTCTGYYIQQLEEDRGMPYIAPASAQHSDL